MSFRKEKKFRLSTSDMLKLKNDLFKTGMTTLHKPRKVNSCFQAPFEESALFHPA